MPGFRDIKRKIGATKNTQKMTKAMKMVAASKLRRSQLAIVNARPYAYKLHSLIARLADSGQYPHPLMEKVENPKKLMLVVFTADRGLCGGFNSSIIKYTDRFYKANKDKYELINFIFIGRKGADYFKRKNVNTIETITNLAGEVHYNLAAKIADMLMSEYTEGKYDEIKIIYNEFKSALSQKVVAERFLPIDALNVEETVGADADDVKESKDGALGATYLLEPSAHEILGQLLPKHFAVQVYRAMLESLASENGSRMTSMENATKNAGSMIKRLTLKYNKMRQAAITTELVEIVGGAEALKG